MSTKELLERFIDEIWNEGDTYRLVELVSDDFVVAPFPPDLTADRDGYVLFVLMLRSAFSDLEITVDEALIDGDRGALRCTLTGTHDGDLAGIAATDRNVSVDQIMMIHTDGAKITAIHSVINGFDLLEQIGAGPEMVAR